MRHLRGELDWITLRTLAKNRDERYETAMALADDIQRFLNDEPVAARPPSAGYQVAKFIRRNRVPVAAAAVATLAVVAGLVLATVGFVHARHERDMARHAKDELVVANRAMDKQLRETEAARMAETEANDRARTDAATTEAVNRFLNNILRTASPRRLGRDTTVRAAGPCLGKHRHGVSTAAARQNGHSQFFGIDVP